MGYGAISAPNLPYILLRCGIYGTRLGALSENEECCAEQNDDGTDEGNSAGVGGVDDEQLADD